MPRRRSRGTSAPGLETDARPARRPTARTRSEGRERRAERVDSRGSPRSGSRGGEIGAAHRLLLRGTRTRPRRRCFGARRSTRTRRACGDIRWDGRRQLAKPVDRRRLERERPRTRTCGRFGRRRCPGHVTARLGIPRLRGRSERRTRDARARPEASEAGGRCVASKTACERLVRACCATAVPPTAATSDDATAQPATNAADGCSVSTRRVTVCASQLLRWPMRQR